MSQRVGRLLAVVAVLALVWILWAEGEDDSEDVILSRADKLVLILTDPTPHLKMYAETPLMPPSGLMRTFHWKRDTETEADTPEDDVFFVGEADGLRWTKRWVMSSDGSRDDIRLEVSVSTRTQAPAGKARGEPEKRRR